MSQNTCSRAQWKGCARKKKINIPFSYIHSLECFDIYDVQRNGKSSSRCDHDKIERETWSKHFSLFTFNRFYRKREKNNKWMVRRKEKKSNETFSHRNLLTQPEQKKSTMISMFTYFQIDFICKFHRYYLVVYLLHVSNKNRPIYNIVRFYKKIRNVSLIFD